MCCFTYVINYQIKPVELKKMIVYIMSFACRYKPFWSSFLMLIKYVISICWEYNLRKPAFVSWVGTEILCVCFVFLFIRFFRATPE